MKHSKQESQFVTDLLDDATSVHLQRQRQVLALHNSRQGCLLSSCAMLKYFLDDLHAGRNCC